jgi:hypothetical protein
MRYLSYSAFVLGWALITIISDTSTIYAEETYRYERDLGFLTVLMMPSEVPLTNHKETNQYCGGDCHWLYPPGILPAKSWKAIMSKLNTHFGEKVELSSDLIQNIEKYLVNHAGEVTYSSTSVKILDGIADNQTPLSVFASKSIKRKHHKIDNEIYARQSIKNSTNCPACHIGVKESGDFDEHDVEIPER